MKTYIKILSLILTILLVFCSCGNKSTNVISFITEKKKIKPATFNLCVNSNTYYNNKETIDLFVNKCLELSNNKLKINILPNDQELSSENFSNDLIFATNDEISKQYQDFNAFSSPFYFKDYDSMTTILNSETFFDLVEDKLKNLCGCDILNCYYGGCYYFISNQESNLDSYKYFKDLKVNINDSNDYLEVLLKYLGANINSSSKEKVENDFLKGKARTIECSPDFLLKIKSDNIKDAKIYFFNTFHKVDLNWLIINDESKKIMDDYYYSIIKLASSYALYENDKKILNKENEGINNIKSLGISLINIGTDYYDYTEESFNNAVRYRNLWDWELSKTIRNLSLGEIGKSDL